MTIGYNVVPEMLQPLLYQTGFVSASLTILVSCTLALLLSLKLGFTVPKLLLMIGALTFLCEKIMFVSSPYSSYEECMVIARTLQPMIGIPGKLVSLSIFRRTFVLSTRPWHYAFYLTFANALVADAVFIIYSDYECQFNMVVGANISMAANVYRMASTMLNILVAHLPLTLTLYRTIASIQNNRFSRLIRDNNLVSVISIAIYFGYVLFFIPLSMPLVNQVCGFLEVMYLAVNIFYVFKVDIEKLTYHPAPGDNVHLFTMPNSTAIPSVMSTSREREDRFNDAVVLTMITSAHAKGNDGDN